MNLLIMGAPGAGKGSVSRKIVDYYHVVHISTGDVLRAAIKEGTPIGKIAQEYINQGALVPDEIIHDIIVEKLKSDDVKNGFIFDGYPRNLAQAKDFESILEEVNLKIDHVISMEIDEDELIKRITGRRNCPKCGAIFNIYAAPSKVEGVCDNCGEKLIQRKDDTLEALQTRLVEYHTNTEPVIEYYKNAGIVHSIDAGLTRDEVFAQVKSALGE